MPDHTQTDRTPIGTALAGGFGLGRDCLPFEAMLADSIDGLLSPEDQKRFDAHLATCQACAGMRDAARQGSAFLDLLKPFPPEPPADLLHRILEQTSLQTARDAETARLAAMQAHEADSLLGRPATPAFSSVQPPVPAPGRVLPFRSRLGAAQLRPALQPLLQPRLAMTAAMAFFSVALTLNLTGVHLSQLHARDLRPSNLKRSFYEADARLVRYYESFRVVYELESRVRDLQQRSESSERPASQAPAPSSQPDSAQPESSHPAQPPAGSPHSSNGQGSSSRPPSQDRPGMSPARDSAPGQAGTQTNPQLNLQPSPRSGPPSRHPFPADGVPPETLAADLRGCPLQLRNSPLNSRENTLQYHDFSAKGGLA